MEHRFQSSTSTNEQEDSASTPGNDAESRLSGDEATVTDEPSPKKSKRSMEKKVISVPIGEVDGSRTKGEVYPPSDSWAWRKYGQKPIKGSPFPRGYYRCSSSKGCPARKHVERSRQDPTMLLISYSFEHNHPPLPTTSRNTHNRSTNSITAATLTTTSSSVSTIVSNGNDGKFPPEEPVIFANQSDLEPDSSFSDFTGYFSCWFSDVESTTTLETFVGPTCMDADVALMLPIREEDQTLFGDLGELPECSVVFGRCRLETIC